MTAERPPLDAAGLLRAVGLLADGPVVWGRPVRATGPGVFVVELPAPLPAAPIELTRVGKWIERVPDLRLDGRRPTSRQLAARLAAFWIPSTSVLYLGATEQSVGGRLAAMERTSLGDRRPHAGGHWLRTLLGLERARVWWAPTDAVEEYEDALLEAFAAAVPAGERERLHDPRVVLPFANLRTGTGDRKAHGLTGSLLADESPPASVPAGRVVELPPGDADGSRDGPRVRAAGGTARRTPKPRLPARPATAAPHGQPVYLSAEGLGRLREEHALLVGVRRPEVIGRIRAAKELGDLKENADYTAAREEQSFLEGRIAALEALLREAVDLPAAPDAGAAAGRVRLGAAVEVEEVDGPAGTTTWRIVGSAEADPAAGRISNVSPVGRALVGRSVGDVVVVGTPRGEARYRIVAVE